MVGHFLPNIPLFLISETLVDTKFGDLREWLIERSSLGREILYRSRHEGQSPLGEINALRGSALK